VRFLSALIDKESAKVQVLCLMCQTVKADQSQLDFRMSAVAWDLPGTGAEDCRQIIREPNRNIEQTLFPCRLVVGNCRFNQVSRAIELMEITEVFEPVTRTPGQNMAVEITVTLLGVCQEFDRSVDERLELWVFMVLKVSARCLQPFCNVGIPENASAPVPVARFLSASMHALIEPERVQVTLMPHFIVDMDQGDSSDLLLELLPKTVGD
jgi:hypothetical protein